MTFNEALLCHILFHIGGYFFFPFFSPNKSMKGTSGQFMWDKLNRDGSQIIILDFGLIYQVLHANTQFQPLFLSSISEYGVHRRLCEWPREIKMCHCRRSHKIKQKVGDIDFSVFFLKGIALKQKCVFNEPGAMNTNKKNGSTTKHLKK